METGVAVTLIRKFSSILLPLISFYTAIACAATPVAPPTPAEIVRAVLSAPDTALNYMTAKRSEEHTSELQSLMRISYAVFCLKKQIQTTNTNYCTYN